MTELAWEDAGRRKWESKRPIFPAKFSGRCGSGDRIKQRELVCYIGKTLYHDACAEQIDPSDPNPPPSPPACPTHGIPGVLYRDGWLRCVMCVDPALLEKLPGTEKAGGVDPRLSSSEPDAMHLPEQEGDYHHAP